MAQGTPDPISLSIVSGTLPPGLSFSNFPATPSLGDIFGNPSQAGAFNFTIQATAINCTQRSSFSISIFCLSLTVSVASSSPQAHTGSTACHIDAAQLTSHSGQPYFLQAAVGGQYTPPITYSVNTLPAALTLDSPTGLISGTVGVAGTYSWVVTATDASLCTGSLPTTVTFLCTPLQVNTTIPQLLLGELQLLYIILKLCFHRSAVFCLLKHTLCSWQNHLCSEARNPLTTRVDAYIYWAAERHSKYNRIISVYHHDYRQPYLHWKHCIHCYSHMP